MPLLKQFKHFRQFLHIKAVSEAHGGRTFADFANLISRKTVQRVMGHIDKKEKPHTTRQKLTGCLHLVGFRAIKKPLKGKTKRKNQLKTALVFRFFHVIISALPKTVKFETIS